MPFPPSCHRKGDAGSKDEVVGSKTRKGGDANSKENHDNGADNEKNESKHREEKAGKHSDQDENADNVGESVSY